MKDFVLSGLKFFDYFGQPVQITFNQQRIFRTVLGGFFSLIIYGVTFSLVVSSASNLLNKVEPKTTMTNKVLGGAPHLKLDEMSLVYVTAFLDRNYNPLYDPEIITMNFYQFKRERQPDGSMLAEYIPLETIDCENYKQNFIKSGFEDEYVGNNISKGLCFNSTGMVIGGEFN